ncbi:YlxR family protein [Mycoplasma sp. 744]|uniref:YlxR family protein n=1 Tax=unclassified Mycoplasma TaxID=2683645 RepID=UPI00211CF0F0|nr:MULTISPECIES: YlxR family protein [unclassified Mycoplasma]MEA4115229.1 YlxR family protein [Mycoplasma sp. 744]UUM19235.1 YlxR family protein [Mycoplasma sp. 1018B]
MKTDRKTLTKRKCFITNQIYPVNLLIRIDYKKTTNQIQLDLNNNLKGRGAYFYPTKENWEKILKFKGLNRIFRTNVTRDTYEKINKELEQIEWVN